MLNAPAMECDRVNFRWGVPVQKRQQIFETVPIRHRGYLFSDEVAPMPEQQSHYSTVPFRTFVNAAKDVFHLVGLFAYGDTGDGVRFSGAPATSSSAADRILSTACRLEDVR